MQKIIVTGALFVLDAIGMRRVLRGGRSGTWGPRLVAAFGIGLVAAGVFVTDPGAGFPVGAPAGRPEQFSSQAILHEIGFLLAQVSWLAACFVFARRFSAIGWRGWVAACVATPLVTLVIAGFPHLESISMRLVLASAIELGFLGAVSARLLRGVGRHLLVP